jgi:hypothetical protein
VAVDETVRLLGTRRVGGIDVHRFFALAAEHDVPVVRLHVRVVGEPTLRVGVFGGVEFLRRRWGIRDATGGPDSPSGSSIVIPCSSKNPSYRS